eukprot:5863756-Prymnesium_polylepis.1
MGDAPPKWVLPISSVNEDKLLKLIGLTTTERSKIEGLLERRRSSASSIEPGVVVREEQQVTGALIRLATNPPPEVGDLQRRSQSWMLRPYPLGLRL